MGVGSASLDTILLFVPEKQQIVPLSGQGTSVSSHLFITQYSVMFLWGSGIPSRFTFLHCVIFFPKKTPHFGICVYDSRAASKRQLDSFNS